MKILKSEFSRFSEVDHLNKRFIPNKTKQKLMIEAISPKEKYLENYPILIKELREFFPSLDRHDCSNGKCYDTSRPEHDDTGPLKKFDNVIDVMHIIEHIMIELQCSISLMPMCSGITCHCWEPQTRYEIFVEAVDEKIGAFSGNFAVELVRDIIRHGKLHSKYKDVLTLAKFFTNNPELTSSIRKIPKQTGFSLNAFGTAVNDLIRFKYL